MFDVPNPFSTNMLHELKNHTEYTYYGVSINGSMFYITPDECTNQFTKNFIHINIYRKETEANVYDLPDYSISSYKPPVKHLPTYIPEVSVVLFESKEERTKMVEQYGNGRLLVEAYSAQLTSLKNGSYKVLVSLSQHPYYTVVDNKVYRLPIASKEYIQEAIVKFDLTKEQIDESDSFVIETILRNSLTGKANIVHREVKTIKTKLINKNNPIVFKNSGLFVFYNKDACESFIDNYDGDMDIFLRDRAMFHAEEEHEKEIQRIILKTREEKRSIANIFAIMGGTGLASLIVENVVRNIFERQREKQKRKETKDLINHVILTYPKTSLGTLIAGAAVGSVYLYSKYK